MKRFILTLALAYGSLMAQNNNENKPVEPIEQSIFSIGVKGGFGQSFIVPYNNYLFNSSWNAGLSAIYAPWVHWGVGMDVTYSSEGATFYGSDVNFMTKLDYLRVPVKAIYFFQRYENDFRPKVSIGPTLGFLVDDHGNKGYSGFDFGATAAAGFNYRLLRAVWLNADVSYYQGLIDSYSANSENDMNGNVRLDLGISVGF